MSNLFNNFSFDKWDTAKVDAKRREKNIERRKNNIEQLRKKLDETEIDIKSTNNMNATNPNVADKAEPNSQELTDMDRLLLALQQLALKNTHEKEIGSEPENDDIFKELKKRKPTDAQSANDQSMEVVRRPMSPFKREMTPVLPRGLRNRNY